MKPILECVPNFSEGRNPEIINSICDQIRSVSGVKLLNVDPGKATNRTVVTLVGDPDSVIDAAFLAIKKASELIDMSKHSGEHPRMGATDVCPLIPISGMTMDDASKYAEKLAERVGKSLSIPVFLYEYSAKSPDRKNLANIRSGEYEGMAEKLKDKKWKPDYGPDVFNERAGTTAIGARDFLVAYNINLNTSSVRRANAVAFDVREKGRVKREGDSLKGKIVRDENGDALREPGLLKSVKAIGWYIEEYGIAQISMNLTDLTVTSLHKAFETVRECANKRGLRVTGSELVGLVPRKVLTDAGDYFLKQQERSLGISEEEKIKIAIRSLGLSELSEFNPDERVIEYMLEEDNSKPLVSMDLVRFANTTASESPAPGGGSIASYVGALGAALGAMVANLSAHKRGWDDKWEYFSDFAVKAQEIKETLLFLVDEDTRAFNGILDAIRMPKSSEEEKAIRKKALDSATRYAIEVPLKTMETAQLAYPVLKEMALNGLKASVSDAGVGAICIHTAIEAAYFNVHINCKDFDDQAFVEKTLETAAGIIKHSEEKRKEIVDLVHKEIQS